MSQESLWRFMTLSFQGLWLGIGPVALEIIKHYIFNLLNSLSNIIVECVFQVFSFCLKIKILVQ